MYHQINITKTFRECHRALLEGAENRRVARGVRSGPGSNPIGVAATTLSFVITLVVLVGVVLVALSTPAHAETTFSVSSTSDTQDANLDDGICSDSSGHCTLRAAIQQANRSPGADTIIFGISGNGVHTIRPTSGLPDITDRVTIDGYTQQGANPNTETQPGKTNAVLKIELDGTAARQSPNGLRIEAGGSGSVVKGLVINRFLNDAIEVVDSSQNTIEGNFIGTDPSGTLDRGNSGDGVEIFRFALSNTVGGNSPTARNLISGNGGIGIRIDDFTQTASFNRVQGNLIGTKKDGTTALGNSSSGLIIDSVSNNTVAGNTIAFNGKDGVGIVETLNSNGNLNGRANGNLLAGNSIFSNVEQGIDLGSDGLTPDDSLDPDPGPNDLQNFPLLSSAKTSRKGTTIIGSLNSTPTPINGPPKTFLVQFYSNASGDEGQKFIGQVGVTTDSSGNASFTFKPAQKVKKGKITATAIDTASQNTSEFSAAKKVVVRKRR